MTRLATAILLACVLGQPATADQADATVARAFERVQMRAAAGDVVAQFSLGAMLYYGSADTADAIRWIRKAAGQHYAPAELHLGQLHEYGFGVTSNIAEALTWYRCAAAHGSAAAERAIGELYQTGRGVPKDLAEAARWFRRAADSDDLRAQSHLGQMYLDGAGVPRDYVSAFVWLTIAAGQTPLEDNRQGLIELRNIAAARLAPDGISEAQRRVAAWKPTHR